MKNEEFFLPQILLLTTYYLLLTTYYLLADNRNIAFENAPAIAQI
jgi:hypothetical protein